jgi:protein-L-isoaspartate(D-aspartate) O-methyltransferase
MDVEHARFNMIEQQIRPWDVLDPTVLDALGRLRREDFVPPEHRAMAFVDTRIPLRDGADAGACMLEPRVEARMAQELRLRDTDRVLEIGTGSGYMAALLALLAADVTTLEIDAGQALTSEKNLIQAGLTNARVIHADGSQGWSARAPYDAIVLSGSLDQVPQTLLDQLKPGGRLIAIVGQLPIMRARLYTRSPSGVCAHEDLFDTVAPRLRGFPEPSHFRF